MYVVDYANVDNRSGNAYECQYIAYAKDIADALLDFYDFFDKHKSHNSIGEIFSITMKATVYTDDGGAIMDVDEHDALDDAYETPDGDIEEDEISDDEFNALIDDMGWNE